jgi:hypothetical protein
VEIIKHLGDARCYRRSSLHYLRRVFCLRGHGHFRSSAALRVRVWFNASHIHSRCSILEGVRRPLQFFFRHQIWSVRFVNILFCGDPKRKRYSGVVRNNRFVIRTGKNYSPRGCSLLLSERTIGETSLNGPHLGPNENCSTFLAHVTIFYDILLLRVYPLIFR